MRIRPTSIAGVVEGDVHRLPLHDGRFGTVVVANALHHVADPLAALREIARVPRPGGRVVAYEPRAIVPLERVKKVLRRGNDAFGAHHRAFGADEYVRLFMDAGLEVTRFGAVDAVGRLVAAELDLLRVGRLGIGHRSRALSCARMPSSRAWTAPAGWGRAPCARAQATAVRALTLKKGGW